MHFFYCCYYFYAGLHLEHRCAWCLLSMAAAVVFLPSLFRHIQIQILVLVYYLKEC